MKAQRRSDAGGRVPPTQDDYDDYADEQPSLDGEVDSEIGEAMGRANGDSQPGPARPSDEELSRASNPGGRVRPPAGVARSAGANLPRRRQRPESTAPAQAEAKAGVPIPSASSPAPRPPAQGKGNGKRDGVRAGIAVAPDRSERLESHVAPAVPQAAPEPIGAEPQSAVSRVFSLILSYETLIYLAFFAFALITRFWDLGNRGIHHDESLHAVFSRTLYIGGGYTHDPMMHGPMQFNLIAVMYWLFGTSDATARFASAFCGVWVVMSPFFLRRQMGRWPALIASFLLLVSPGVLYFSRMAREDSIFSAMEMIMIVGLWRFVSTRKPLDFFVFCAGLSLMFTIKETAYLTVAVLGVLFALLFAFQAGYAILGALVGYGAAMGAMVLFINGRMKSGEIPKLPDIPVQNPDYQTITGFAANLIAHPLVQWGTIITVLFLAALVFLFRQQRRRLMGAGYQDASGEEAIVRPTRPVRPSRSLPGATASTQAPAAALPARRKRAAGVDGAGATVPIEYEAAQSDEVEVASEVRPPTPDERRAPSPAFSTDATDVYDPSRLDPRPGTLLAHYEPGSLPHLVGALFSRPSVLVIGFLIATTIFVTLYTVFFTDTPRGIASGLFASLGYWMAQHGVTRGDQPWYYYLLLIPLYQPIAVFFSLAATAFFSVKGIRGLLRRREERIYGERDEPGLGLFNVDRPVPFAKFSVFLPLFMIWWMGGAFFIYSWAGEKMPWLMVHMTRPAIFLAALFLGALLASVIKRRQERIASEREYYAEYEEYAPAPAPAPALQPGASRRERGSALPERRGSSGSGSARTQAVRTQRYVRREQDPPWITWNRSGSNFPLISFLTIFTLLALAWGLKLNALTQSAAYDRWGESWFYPVLMLVLVGSYAVWLGVGRSLRYLALGIFSVFFLYEIRSATQLTYAHPDVPTDMAVYVQTSPDVTRSMRELTEYSNYATGGLNAKVVYDSFASWPYEWYLRDFKNKQFIGGGEPPTDGSVEVMFLEYAKHNNDAKLADYLPQRYAMRWWFPEDWYKSDLIRGLNHKTSPMNEQIGAILNTTAGTITDPKMTSTLWKYLIFREPPKPLGSEDMIVFVRRDIAQVYHYLQYKPSSNTDEPPITVRTPPPPDGSRYR